MTYTVRINSARRIDSTIKTMLLKNANQFNETLRQLDDLNMHANLPHFQSQLDNFLTNNPDFKEAFRYEGWFTKNAFFGKWCRSEHADLERSKKILVGLIIAMKKRIEHLKAKRETVLKKMDALLPKITPKLDYWQGGVPKEVSRESFDGKSLGIDDIDKLPSVIIGKMEASGMKKTSLYNKMKLYLKEAKDITEEIAHINCLKIQAEEALKELEKEWAELFSTYYNK